MNSMKYLIIILSLLIGHSWMNAQILGLCNADTLYVKDNTVVMVKGDFLNNHTDFENHGEFNVEGNLENSIELDNEGTGVIRLIGIHAQLINLTGEFKTFNLDIDNENGAVFLGDKNMSVFGDLDFVNGRFWTRENNLINFKPNAVYFGARDESHIDGPAIKEGDTRFRFPIGKEGVLRPLAISELNGLNSYQAEYFPETYPIQSTDGSLSKVSDFEFWSFDRIFGNDNPQLTLVWDENSFLDQPFTDLQIAYIENNEGWTQVASSFDLPEQLETDLTSVSDIPGYGFYTFATTNSTTLLQDGLTDFSLSKQGCNVRVDWTAIERRQRVNSYQIERRLSPSQEYEVVFSTLANNIQLIDGYTYVDNDVNDNTIYHYRLVVNYFDGTSIASEDKFIQSSCSPISLLLYPNPVFQDGIITLAINSDIEKTLNVKVVDVLGRVLQSHALEIKKGSNSFEIANTIHYGAAEYFLWTPEDEQIPTIKFQIIR